MSFTGYKKPELLQIADAFGVDEVDADSNVAAIQAALAENGVTEKMWKDMQGLQVDVVPEPAVTPVKEYSGNTVLLKMDRENGTFEIYGYKFTRDHPFAVVKEEDADKICRAETGFRIALPSEASEYYK